MSTPHAHHERQLSILAINLDVILLGQDTFLQVSHFSDAVSLENSVGQVGAMAVCICEVEGDIDPEGDVVCNVVCEDDLRALIRAEVNKRVMALLDVRWPWMQWIMGLRRSCP